jgi:ribosomal-protein-alanine N-acetyltransferase
MPKALASDRPEVRFEPLGQERLGAVLEVENRAYAHPWSRANFSDVLHSGYQAQILIAEHTILGYFVAMKGVDEVHLLNITVAPEHQRQGWAHLMLDALDLWARGQGAHYLWLEVRVGNTRAREVYLRHGFSQVGQRKSYYAAGRGQREDAVVMNLRLA